jgi:hypothetical protein
MTRSTSAVAQSGTFSIGGDLPVHRLGYGVMQLPGPGVWGPPRDHDAAIRVLRRVHPMVPAGHGRAGRGGQGAETRRAQRNAVMTLSR